MRDFDRIHVYEHFSGTSTAVSNVNGYELPEI